MHRVLIALFIGRLADNMLLDSLGLLIVKLYTIYLYCALSYTLSLNSAFPEKEFSLSLTSSNSQQQLRVCSKSNCDSDSGFYSLYMLPGIKLKIDSFQKGRWLVRNSDKSFVNGTLRVDFMFKSQKTIILTVGKSGCITTRIQP